MNQSSNIPSPIFDAFEFLMEQEDFSYLKEEYNISDIKQAHGFLKAYRGSAGTFNSYRREIERLLQWCALIAKKNLAQIKREDIEHFIEFCQNPPKTWIGTHKPPKFIEIEAVRVANPEWRPFIVAVSKASYRKGERAEIKDFELKQGALKQIFAIIGSFYNYLLQEEYVPINPVAMIRQKSKYVRKIQETPKIRRLSDLQWHYVLETATKMADNGEMYDERTLFIMSALYSMYLRISELAASKRWSPKMNHFFCDSDGNWWFVTVGKGNKQRQIAVSDNMLNALRRWRKHLNLAQNPSPSDSSPLLPKAIGKGPISSTTYIRSVVQKCFDSAIIRLQHDNFIDEAESLTEATVHWLRHTGISEDVKIRPKEHVRDDAGHSSSAITDKYIDIKLRERHESAKSKPILSE